MQFSTHVGHFSQQADSQICMRIVASYGMEDFFAPLVAKACTQVMPVGASTFNVDSVRVNKIIGGSFGMSTLVNGMVVPRDTEGASTLAVRMTEHQPFVFSLYQR